MNMTASRRLGEFVATLDWASVPEEVLAHTKVCVLDTVACGLYGSTTKWAQIAREAATATSGVGAAKAWGTGDALAPATAALVNGTAVHSFELDDLHPRSILHPGATVLPSALAAASLLDRAVSGRELLLAVTAGYEVGARAGSALGGAHLLAGWHPTGTHGTLAAAAATSAILGIDGVATAHALGIAGSMSSGLMASQYGAMVKRLHAGHAAQSGLMAGVLAARGFTGIEQLFESEYGGYLSTFASSSRPDVITAELGSRWETLSVGFKRYSACGSTHTSIDAIRDLRERYEFHADDVDSVEIESSTATYKHVGWPYNPDSVTTAQMNLPYAVAVTLVDGDAFVDQYAAERIHDGALIQLAQRVTVRADPEIDQLGDSGRHNVRVTVHRRGSAPSLTATRQYATGSAQHPLRSEDVKAKYHRLSDGVLGSHGSLEVRRTIEAVEELKDVKTLSAMLGQGVAGSE